MNKSKDLNREYMTHSMTSNNHCHLNTWLLVWLSGNALASITQLRYFRPG